MTYYNINFVSGCKTASFSVFTVKSGMIGQLLDLIGSGSI